MIQGRRRELGLGGFPLVSLAEARAKAFAYRKVARDGGDPLTEKRRADGIPTFADAAERVWKGKNPGWRHPGHAQDWMSSLRRHVLPHIGQMPVCDVSSADVLDTLRRIWHVRPETARRVRQRISAVMEWAIAMELRTDNPCDRLGGVLGPQQDLVQHMRALPHGEVAAAIQAMWASGATTAVKLAFRVPRADGGALGGSARRAVDRDRSAGRRLDDPCHAHEVQTRAPGSAVRARGGDSRGGAPARRRPQPVRVPEPGREAVLDNAAAAALAEPEDRGRAARFPIQLPGLGG